MNKPERADSVRFGAAMSEHPDPAAAIGEVLGSVIEAVGTEPDAAVVFVSSRHAESLDDISATVTEILAPATMIGTTAASVVGGAVEAEEGPAVSVWAGRIGDCESVRLESIDSGDGAVVVGMPDEAADGSRILLLLTEPYSFPTDALVAATRAQYPELTVVGGMASAGGPGANRLVVDGVAHRDGAVGVLLPAGLDARVVVAQGCRPVGDPYIVTDSSGNAVVGLGSRTALERLREIVDAADDDERELLSRGLHVGLAIDESKADFGRGDFLIRGVLGADHATGTLHIGDRAEVGTTLQFHVRDAAAASDDLDRMFQGIDGTSALVFTCNGRGTRLFGRPDHDASAVSEVVGRGPVAGMSCAGEMGPVGGVNHVHGFTASVLVFGVAPRG